jgi:hypothetical protein
MDQFKPKNFSLSYASCYEPFFPLISVSHARIKQSVCKVKVPTERESPYFQQED